MTVDTNQPQLMTEREAAQALRISGACLRRWRSIGAGPPWLRIGKRCVRYEVAALREWIEHQRGARDVG